MTYRRWLLALLLAMMLFPAMATARVLDIAQPPTRLDLEPWITFVCDEQSPRNITTLRQSDPATTFKPLLKPHIAFGFRQDACWFRWEMRNTGTQTRRLLFVVDYPVLDHVDLYQDSQRSLTHWALGDALAFSQRQIDSRSFVIPLTLEPGQIATYYLRAQSSGSMTVPLYVSDHDNFIGMHERNEWLLGIFYGISLGLLFYHAFLWGVLREKIYRFYVLHLAASLTYLATLQGLGFQLWPQWIEWNNRSNMIAGYLVFMTDVLFARDYLNTRDWRTGDRYLVLLTALNVSALLIQGFMPAQVMYQSLAAMVILTMTSLLVTGVIRWRQGLREARHFILAWGLFMLMTVIFSLKTYGIFAQLPVLQAVNLLQVGMIIQQVLLSLGLADRLAALKQEKAFREQEILRAHAENEAKGDFLAKMSHEIRTPMNAVIGLTQLLKDSRLDHHQRDQVNLLQSAGKSLLDLINDILDYSKINAGKLELEKTVFNLPALMSDCISIFAVNADQKSLSLAYEPMPNIPAWVKGDPVRIRQVTSNLLSNAIKFTSRGQIHVRLKWQASPVPGQIRILVEVEDTGIGLSQDEIPQLFQAFQQADVSTTRQYGGSGLGLAISRQLVELMHGDIGVTSIPGKGSTFWFRIPLDLGNAPVQSVASEAPSRKLAGRKLLVVEDNPVNQLVITGLLRKLGISPLVSPEGQASLDLLQQHPEIELVLMDCEMPGMDGYEATRQLRQREHKEGRPRLPVVALTAHAMASHKERCLEAGMDDHLSKPVVLEDLAAILQRHLPD
jgi:signal transduction histidine kinase/CheY-like chemotaxis protein